MGVTALVSWEGIKTSGATHRGALRRGALVALALVAVSVAGCGGGGSSSGSTTGETKPVAEGTGKAIFEQQCSSCHKLAAAKATFGTYGPDLDQLEPSQETVEHQVTNGGGIMPAYGKHGLLSTTEIEAVASYVATEAGK